MSDSVPSPLAVAETAAFVMIGAAATLQRCLPKIVSTQKSKWDQQVVLARFLGQMAVGQARQEIRRRLATRPTTSEESVKVAGVAPQEPDVGAPVAVVEVGPVAAELAIDHYDELSAAQVIDRLEHLDGDQLDAVHRYESQHRRRRTVLGRVEQLRARLAPSSG